MNVYDAGRMAGVLAPLGYREVDAAEAADLLILNTCHIREKASDKVYSELGRLKQLKRERAAAGAPLVIAVAGCIAQAEGAEIVRRAPQVDMVFGPQTYHRLPELLGRLRNERHVLDTEFPLEDKFEYLPRPRTGGSPTAFLTIQEGCDKFCAFCVVPYTRGPEASRPVLQVEREALALIEGGTREITILGQNVNAYRGAGPDGEVWSLARLIGRLSALPGLDRLRYTTSHPRDMSEDLILAHRDNPKLMPYLHLPVQAGSDRILDAMNRQHTADDYRRVVERVRAARPDIALSSDFIVGFPGEAEADFAATLALTQAIGFAHSFSFMYSPRPGTPGAGLPDQVPDDVKTERLARLKAALHAQQHAFNTREIGRALHVLIDRQGREAGNLAGRSPYLQAVRIEGASAHARIGDIVAVEITAAETFALAGRLAARRAAAE